MKRPWVLTALVLFEGGKVRVTIPAGTRLPARVRAYVVADVFPVASRVM